jgi:uncharacterized membrane protein
MSAQPLAAASRTHFPELDLLRGIAVVFMVLNHSGLAWGGEASHSGLLRALTFVGEFAPVLFFFTTGVGHGLRPTSAAPGRHWDVAYKVALLLLADWFLHPSLTNPQTDFLAFIAGSMLLLHVLGGLRHANLVCWLLLGFSVGGRFGLGVGLRHIVETDHWLLAFLGVGALPFSSYTLLPWLAYPLAGYLAGRWLAKHDWTEPSVRRRAQLLLAAVAVLTGALGGVMVAQGQQPYRWGSVSVAFFVLSCAVVPIAALIALGLRRIQGPANAGLAVSGPASFAAVPIHYLFVAELAPLFSRRDVGLIVACASLALSVLVLELSRRFSVAATQVMRRVSSPRALAAGGVGFVLLLVGMTLAVAAPWTVRLACLSQLLICGLLVNRIVGLQGPKPVQVLVSERQPSA